MIPTVSILIPACDNLDLTSACLDSVLEHTHGMDCQVVAIDNACTDGTGDYLEAVLGLAGGDHIVLRAEPRVPYAKANNMAARVASGQYLCLLNNDIVAYSGWLSEMLKVFRRQERVGIVGSRLVYPSGHLQHAGIVFRHRAPMHVYYQLQDSDAPYLRRTREMQAVTGACMLIPRALYWEMGGLDEAYRNCYEDTDLCLRVRDAGHRVMYCGASVLTHYEGRTAGRHAHEDQNHDLFMSRWGRRVQDDYEKVLEEDGFSLGWASWDEQRMIRTPDPPPPLLPAGDLEAACIRTA